MRAVPVFCMLLSLSLAVAGCGQSWLDRGSSLGGHSAPSTPALIPQHQNVESPAEPVPTQGSAVLATGDAAADDQSADDQSADDQSTDDIVVSRELISSHRLSQGSDGEPGNGPASDIGMSADGSFVAYTSVASNLVTNDGNGVEDVFLYDATREETTLISMNTNGAAGDGWSSGPAVSADGRLVAFYSWAGDLTPGDSNAVQDVFVWDSASRNIERISLSPDGLQANDRSGDSRHGARPAISASGSVVAYHSQASNLVDLDTNNRQDVFLYDAGQRQTTRVSISTDGEQGDGDARDPSLSADGRVVVYSSRASNLDVGFPNPDQIGQVYLHNRDTGMTRLLSGLSGDVGDDASITPVVSGDGSTIVFASHAANLIDDDVNASSDIFLYDVPSAKIERISVTSAGAPGNGDSYAPVISLDGRYVGYASAASNLVNGDGNDAADIFVYDRLTRHTGRASVAVTGQWTGVEANDDSVGPPALAVGGRLVAYVSLATNLVAGETPEFAEVYALVRDDLPAYTVSGRVQDSKNRPAAGVAIVAGPHQAMTDEEGRYALTNVTGGTYAVVPSREEMSFAPARRTVSAVADVEDVDFTVLSNGGARLSFLSLPFGGEYSTAVFLQALRDSEEGGWVDAWFDHDAPDKSKNDAVQLWDGRERSTGFFHTALGCYERRCYDGHDGTDFPYRDPKPATAAYEPLLLYPAAPGRVASLTDDCGSGGRWCNGGYGNEVILIHENGYFTRYAHLASIRDKTALEIGAPVDVDDALGVMGSTGNSYGAHLHFAVHQDDGNGRWDGEEKDGAVDPFGWSGQQPDPWSDASGAVSRWLWNEHPTVERLVFGDHGTKLRDQTGAITVDVPPGALVGQARLELESGASVAPPESGLRSAGQTVRLRLLDWYAPEGEIIGPDELADANLALPIDVAVELDDGNTRHLDMGRAHIVRWDEKGEQWSVLPTIVARDGVQISAISDRLGSFDVQAPLLCSGDALEPDDEYYAASYVEPGQTSIKRLFDLEDDEDWIRFDATRGQEVRVHVDEIAQGVSLVAEIYDLDGLTTLASAESVDSEPVQMVWSARDDGTYFVRVTRTSGSGSGCDATYVVAVD